MKFIKTVCLALVLVVSTTTAFARGVEETCHEFAEADLYVKRLLQEDQNGLIVLLSRIDKEKNPKIKSLMRERVFWAQNRLDLPDNTFRRLAFIRCLAVMQ